MKNIDIIQYYSFNRETMQRILNPKPWLLERLIPCKIDIKSDGKKELDFPIGWTNFNIPVDQLNTDKSKINAQAVRTGNGIVMVDIDTKDLSALDRDISDWVKDCLAMKDTFTVETTKGYHFYFKCDESMANQVRVSNHVDIRADGGCGIIATNNSEFSYRVINDVEPIEIPPFAYKMMKAKTSTPYTFDSEGLRIREVDREPNIALFKAVESGDINRIIKATGMSPLDFTTHGMVHAKYNIFYFILANEPSVRNEDVEAILRLLVTDVMGFDWNSSKTQEHHRNCTSTMIWAKEYIEPALNHGFGYDLIYFDVSSAKYVFVKPNLKVSHAYQNARQIIPHASRDFFSNVPRYYPDYAPDKEQFFERQDMKFINTFTPSEYVRGATVREGLEIPVNVKLLLYHLIQEQELQDVFINALANHLQKGTSIHIGWIFSGIEGAGKGVLMDLIFTLFGNENCEKTKLKTFTGDKVKGIVDKQIAFCDESATDSKTMYEVVENLKTIIGNFTYASRSLYKDETTVKNHTMYFFATNSYGFKLSSNDRRMNIINTPVALNTVVPDVDKFIQDLKNETQDFANYLVSYKVDNSLLTRVVKTEFREQMISQHLPLAERIAKCIKETSLESMGTEIDYDDKNDKIERVSKALELISQYGKVQGTVLTSIASDIFDLTNIDRSYYKKQSITGKLQNVFSYDKIRINGKQTKVYMRYKNNEKALLFSEYEEYMKSEQDF